MCHVPQSLSLPAVELPAGLQIEGSSRRWCVRCRRQAGCKDSFGDIIVSHSLARVIVPGPMAWVFFLALRQRVLASVGLFGISVQCFVFVE